MRVFILEQSQTLRQRMKERLEQLAGVSVVGDSDHTAEAQACIEQLAPDVLISDVRVRDGSTQALLQRCRQMHPGLKVAVYSARTDSAYRLACKQAGADWFFDKITEPDGLFETLEQLSQSATAEASLLREDKHHE